MPPPIHRTDHESLTEAILDFTHFARQHDFNIGLSESQESLRVASLGLMGEKKQFEYALKSIFCSSEEDGIIFEKIYDDYWKYRGTLQKSKVSFKGQIKKQYELPGTLVFIEKGAQESEATKDVKNTSGAN